MPTLAALGLFVQTYLLTEIEQSPRVNSGADSRREQLLRFVKSQCHRALPLESVAKHLGVSVCRAGHLVKELTGRSFVELKQQLRLESAQQMLLETRLSVESIASLAGYEDVRYFYRVFSKATGVPPGRWRNQHTKRVAVDA